MFHIGFVYTMPTETYPIWTMLSHHRRGAASPRYRNRAKITVFMCQQKPCPVRFSCPRKSCDPYDSVSIDLSYRKCRHYWLTGIFSPTGELGRRTRNRYLYRTFFIFKRHGHNFLPSILPFIDGIFKTQPTGKWNSCGESICIQLFLMQFYILTFHVRIFTLEMKEAGT